METQKKLSKYISYRLRLIGKNRPWLAEQLGISVAQVDRIMAGHSPLSLERIEVIAHAVGMKPSGLIAQVEV